MLSRLRGRLTYANVVATLALFLALGGTSYAVKQLGSNDIRDNSIRSRDVRDNSLGSGDIHNGSLALRDFKPSQRPRGPRGKGGPRGPRGLRGKTGKAGKRGKTGKTGAAGISGVTVVSKDTARDSNNKSGTAQCPSGKRALAGGAILKTGPPGSIALADSGPSGSTPSGWTAGGIEVNNATLEPWQLTVYAVCAKAGR
jgi:hypothetical protein